MSINPARDNIGHRWVKGQSGNPGGRRKQNKTVTEMAREAAPEAMKKLVKIMKDDKATHGIVAVCAEKILERAYGKPTQVSAVAIGDFRKAAELTDDELLRIIQAGTDTSSPQAQLTAAIKPRDLELAASLVEPDLEPPSSE